MTCTIHSCPSEQRICTGLYLAASVTIRTPLLAIAIARRRCGAHRHPLGTRRLADRRRGEKGPSAPDAAIPGGHPILPGSRLRRRMDRELLRVKSAGYDLGDILSSGLGRPSDFTSLPDGMSLIRPK